MKKKILLIDRNDVRRHTRLMLLMQAGYEVELRENHVSSEEVDHEARFDLVILALHHSDLHEAAAYSERLRKAIRQLPILLLTDSGVFVPRGALSCSLETGVPIELMETIAEMLAGSRYIRELAFEENAQKAYKKPI